MASLPPPPPGIDLQADKGPHIISSGIALIVLPTVFVALRLISRYLAQAGFWWDDLLVVTSLLLSYGPNGCMMDCEFFSWADSLDIALEIDKRGSGANQWLWKTFMVPCESRAQYQPVPQDSLHLHYILLLRCSEYKVVHVRAH